MSSFVMPWEAVGVIVGAVLFVGGSLLGVLMSHGNKLATIIQQLVALEKSHNQNQLDHQRFWESVAQYETRITRLEATASPRDGKNP